MRNFCTRIVVNFAFVVGVVSLIAALGLYVAQVGCDGANPLAVRVFVVGVAGTLLGTFPLSTLH